MLLMRIFNRTPTLRSCTILISMVYWLIISGTQMGDKTNILLFTSSQEPQCPGSYNQRRLSLIKHKNGITVPINVKSLVI